MQIIDFYVSVVDNYGDMGFAVNLALSIHEKHPNGVIRFFSDDSILFQKFFSDGVPDWIEYLSLEDLQQENPVAPARLICSFFDYRFPKEYLQKFPYAKTIVSFSYFLLHAGLESLHGTTYTLEGGYDTVIHFVPSLVKGGWGIIVNPEIERRKEELSKVPETETRKGFLGGSFGEISEKKWISVFVYKESLEEILAAMEYTSDNTVFFIFWTEFSYLDWKISGNIVWMPFLSLEDYGVFQSLCDANVVRGENSLCQGILSFKPILWDIYKENNGAHVDKIEDYLSFLGKQFPDTDWNGYSEVMRDFNTDRKMMAFVDFVSEYSEYEAVFKEISEYTRGECDLIGKLKEILGK